uniref:Uncharacterized protein n=1 Tax=Anguilla anguilla TaxID=7936 RepID=A0A0E9UTC4_ANGAN
MLLLYKAVLSPCARPPLDVTCVIFARLFLDLSVCQPYQF